MSNSFPGGLLTTGADTGYSVAFDGSGDYLQLNAPINFGTNNFTIEGWFYLPTLSGSYGLWGASNGGGAQPKFQDYIAAGNYAIDINGSSPISFTAATYFRAGAWNHYALCRGGTGSNQTAIFVNGVRAGLGTVGSQTGTTSNFNIGTNETGAITAGSYISNFRIVNGTDVYGYTNTSINTPTQLFPITNTILLTCQSPTIIDNSASPYTITANGNAAVSNFTPFTGYKGFDPKLGSAAGGVWTLEQATTYQSNRTWPIYDPYFNQTTLLLHGQGTNGANNSSFIDSSSNNFAITKAGNTTQGTFTPFSPTGWSYNGTAGAYCQLNNADYSIGTGDFTIEFWMYCVDDSTYGSTAFAGLTGGGTLTISMTGGSSNARLPYLEFGGSGTTFGTLSGYLNRWTHIAFVRTSGYVVVYQNGVATAAPISKSQSFPNSANLYLARLPTDTAQDFRGYLSNYRITKSAVYSSNFTPSTQPLTVLPNTVLLTFQDNRFRDSSANNSTVTPAGTASVQAFSPYAPSYITPSTYSYKFDGTGDYISTGDASTACAFPASTDFTIECWFNNVATVSDGTIWSTSSSISASEQLRLDGGANNNTLRVISTYTTKITASATYSNSTWNHVAVVRSGTTLTLYLNGTNIGSASNNQSFTADNFTIGSNGGAGGPFPFNGIISNLRVVKGTALYTTNFTPPSGPLAAISGTQLLTCQDSTFKDNSNNNFTITASGDAKPVTSPTPFAPKVDQTTLNTAYSTSLIGGSYYGIATGDYLTFTDTSNLLDMGTVAASFECWYYMTATGAYQNIFLKYGGTGGWNATNGIEYGFAVNNGVPTLSYYIGGSSVATITDPTTRTINQWYHFAIATDTSNNISMYVNGIRVANTTSAITKPTTRTTINVGSTGGQFAVGYLAGMRFLTGSNAYNAALLNIGVPPLTPPTAISGTQMLLNFTNGAIYDNTAKNVLETVGTAQISTTQSKYGGSSMKFDGSTSSWVLVPFSRNLDISTGAPDWTLECWGYVVSFANSPYFFNKGGVAATYYTNYSFSTNTSGVVFCTLGNNSGETSYSFGTCATNTWYHFAATRQGSTIRTFLNGVLVTSQSIATTMTDNGEALYVGCLKNLTSNVLNGYVDDLRITKGVARYTTNFTPPTSALQNQ